MNNTELIEKFIVEAMRGKAENTVKAYRYSLEKFSKWLRGRGTNLNEYGRLDVQQYIVNMQAPRHSASRVNREIAAVKAFSRYVGKVDAIEALHITKPLKYTQAPEWLDRNKVNEVLRNTDLKKNRRDYAIVMVLLKAGLRVSELVALDKEDIIMKERIGWVFVRNSKNKYERKIPINADTIKSITDYLAQRTDDHKALFLSSLSKRLSVRSVQAILNEYEIKPLNLRHSFVKRLIDDGKSISTIKELSGLLSTESIAWYSAKK